ncbi:hypothetical protein BDQ17DRAFT_321705 [Cyathus striatus]|nr:hypothetical protein BDQ17DRAFT_321705 [Cyathus striatus]
MSTAETCTDLNISLEPHLVETLTPLQSLLPSGIRDQLAPHLSKPASLVIPYSLLHEISQWSRTSDGEKILNAHLPPLNPQDYTMVSLLAGTLTSPERKFGKWIPEKDPQEGEAQRTRDRKAITALLNALLSIAGAGIATWWAADKTGWRNEWKALLALFVSILVAIAEGGLYLIWQSRRQNRSTDSIQKEKKDKDELHLEPVVIKAFSSANSTTTEDLRQRRR